MATNTHTFEDSQSESSQSDFASQNHEFEQGETFDGQLPDETIVIREVREDTIVWDYKVCGETYGRNTTETETARQFVKCGVWKDPVE